MRRCLIVLLAAAWLAPASQAAAPARNLAYDDDFVWYLAGRLTAELQMFQEKAGAYQGMDAQTRLSLTDQYQIVHHHFLLECDGPLPDVAKVFAWYDYANPPASNTGLLSLVGRRDGEFWPVLRAWHSRILVRLLAVAAEGKYGFFPECIVAPFLKQNPDIANQLAMTSRKTGKPP